MRKNVLIVEDNEDHALLLSDALKRADPSIYVIHTSDGRNALEYLHGADARIDAPDLIILDICMPHVEGSEVLMRLRMHERTMHVPVIIFSVVTDPGEVVKLYRLGANSFVNKPTGLAELRETVAKMAEYWLQVSLVPRRERSS